MASENVRVAVRVRPFNDREKKRNSVLIIGMNGQTTTIKDPEDKKAEPRKFAFDFSYCSHSDFKERSDGYFEPTSSKYSDQTKVFNDLGKGVLDNAWAGYNTSLFAYGQTGSGKSYSMVGYGTNKGIVPLACEKLFTDIETKRQAQKEGEEYKVSFSMLEIYNEQVRDLLNPKSLKIKGGLKVRQHPKEGFYVETLTYCPVNTYKEIDAKINEGTQNRTVASTNMNATSSRAHTIVALRFSQKSSESGQSMTKTSLINLVDLAGSERAEATGATGDRLKEGSAINQSLSTLGNVIKALADISGGAKKVIVPYRDSMLTKLLKNALGGNSKTIMIAALSPADINYEETLSTLRFADRAKAIKTTAIINESPTDKLIRELREENQRLMDMIKKGGVDPAMLAAMGGGQAASGLSEQDKEEMRREMEAEVKKNQEEMEEMEKSWQDKLAEQEKQFKAMLAAKEKEDEQRKTIPHLWNLNEDQSLTGMVCHFLPTGKSTTFGNTKNDKAQVKLGGLGIQTDHAVIENKKDDKITVKPSKGAKVMLNGQEITSSKELHHNDTLLFGAGNNLFVLHHSKDYQKQQKNKKIKERPTYESAQEEIAKNSGLSSLAGSGKSKDDLLLQDDLLRIWPMVAEANAISEELNKKCKFEITLVAPQARGKDEGRTEVCVTLKDLTNQNEFLWTSDYFINRKFMMQEMYENFANGEDINVPQEQDPFWEDPTKEQMVGTVNVYTMSLAYLLDIDDTLQIMNIKGAEIGFLKVKATPVDDKGKDLDEDQFVEEPEELVGRSFNFKLEIGNANGIPSRFAQSRCKFRVYTNTEEDSTQEMKGMNPAFNFEKVFKFNPVTKSLVEYLKDKKITIEIWGRQAATSGADSDLNTQELMMKDKSRFGSPAKNNDHHYKMAAEANTFKRRMERAEAKLKKIQELVDQAKKQKKDTVKVEDLEKALKSSNRLKAVASIIVGMQKAKKANQQQAGQSQACVLQ